MPQDYPLPSFTDPGYCFSSASKYSDSQSNPPIFEFADTIIEYYSKKSRWHILAYFSRPKLNPTLTRGLIHFYFFIIEVREFFGVEFPEILGNGHFAAAARNINNMLGEGNTRKGFA